MLGLSWLRSRVLVHLHSRGADTGSVELTRFAPAYPAYLASWEQAIAAACAAA